MPPNTQNGGATAGANSTSSAGSKRTISDETMSEAQKKKRFDMVFTDPVTSLPADAELAPTEYPAVCPKCEVGRLGWMQCGGEYQAAATEDFKIELRKVAQMRFVVCACTDKSRTGIAAVLPKGDDACELVLVLKCMECFGWVDDKTSQHNQLLRHCKTNPDLRLEVSNKFIFGFYCKPALDSRSPFVDFGFNSGTFNMQKNNFHDDQRTLSECEKKFLAMLVLLTQCENKDCGFMFKALKRTETVISYNDVEHFMPDTNKGPMVVSGLQSQPLLDLLEETKNPFL